MRLSANACLRQTAQGMCFVADSPGHVSDSLDPLGLAFKKVRWTPRLDQGSHGQLPISPSHPHRHTCSLASI